MTLREHVQTATYAGSCLASATARAALTVLDRALTPLVVLHRLVNRPE